MPAEKDNDFEYEIIDENEMEIVKKGRKAKIHNSLLEAMKKLPKGKVIKLPMFAVEQNVVDDFMKLSKELSTSNVQNREEKNANLALLKKEIERQKAKNSATIRSHVKAAKWANHSINWTPKYCPIVSKID